MKNGRPSPVLAGPATQSGRGKSHSRTGFLDIYFYFFMSLLIAVVVVYGFSQTVGERIIHPAIRRPWVLYLHAVVFPAWLIFYILQSALVRTRNVRLHRQLGWFGAGLGTAIPPVGVSTAIAMTRFNIIHFHTATAEADLVIPLFDMLVFSIAFGLAIYWRTKPELHRRLILIAGCVLTAAAWGRFPPSLLSPNAFYAGVDFLILLAVVRDLIVTGTIHRVYLYGLPAIVLGQAVVMYTDLKQMPAWLKMARGILG